MRTRAIRRYWNRKNGERNFVRIKPVIFAASRRCFINIWISTYTSARCNCWPGNLKYRRLLQEEFRWTLECVRPSNQNSSLLKAWNSKLRSKNQVRSRWGASNGQSTVNTSISWRSLKLQNLGGRHNDEETLESLELSFIVPMLKKNNNNNNTRFVKRSRRIYKRIVIKFLRKLSIRRHSCCYRLV